MEKMNFNLYINKEEATLNPEKKESLENSLEVRKTISGLMSSFDFFEKIVTKTYFAGGFSYPSSRFKIKLLEAVSGKTCSVEDLRNAEKFKPDFDKYLKKVFFKLNGVTKLHKMKGSTSKNEHRPANDMQKALGYKADAKPYDPEAPRIGIENQIKE